MRATTCRKSIGRVLRRAAAAAARQTAIPAVAAFRAAAAAAASRAVLTDAAVREFPTSRAAKPTAWRRATSSTAHTGPIAAVARWRSRRSSTVARRANTGNCAAITARVFGCSNTR